jgi:fructose-bisphosphate aldolase class I
MNKQELADTASAMVALGKGLLAMDESNRTCNKPFEDVGIAPTLKSATRSDLKTFSCLD